MENNETFKMTYSAQQQEEIENIRKKYVPHQEDKMEQLRRLDAGVTKKATAVSLAVGIVGSLILGLGMSLAMTELGQALGDGAVPAGIVIGLVGMGILALACPLYHAMVKKQRAKIAPQILQLTEELMK